MEKPTINGPKTMQKEHSASFNLTDSYIYFSEKNKEDFFYDSLIYICEHDTGGAFGLIVNKPSRLSTRKLFKSLKLQIPNTINDFDRVMHGGPVDADKVFVIHDKQTDSEFSTKLAEDLYLSSDAEILRRISNQNNVGYKIFLGYCGWGANQLEEEVKSGAWEILNISRQNIFYEKPAQLVDRISMEVGYNLRDISKRSNQAH